MRPPKARRASLFADAVKHRSAERAQSDENGPTSVPNTQDGQCSEKRATGPQSHRARDLDKRTPRASGLIGKER